MGPGEAVVADQVAAVEALGGDAIPQDTPDASDLTAGENIGGALWWGDEAKARAYAIALADRPGPIVPLISGQPRISDVRHERHLCVDTTASGGNAELLAAVSGA